MGLEMCGRLMGENWIMIKRLGPIRPTHNHLNYNYYDYFEISSTITNTLP